MQKTYTFEEIFHQNQRRIHYHIHQLKIQDPHQEFYQIGLTSLCEAYTKYQPSKGPMSTYFNCIIRNRLIDHIRQQNRNRFLVEDYLSSIQQNYLNEHHSLPDYDLSEINPLYLKLKSFLSDNQWNWLFHCVLHDLSQKELAELKHTTVDAVKGWAKEAKKKLRKPEIKNLLSEHPI